MSVMKITTNSITILYYGDLEFCDSVHVRYDLSVRRFHHRVGRMLVLAPGWPWPANYYSNDDMCIDHYPRVFRTDTSIKKAVRAGKPRPPDEAISYRTI